jgi:uncharacterized protein YycO
VDCSGAGRIVEAWVSNGVEHVHVEDMDNAKHFIADWVAETFGRAVG